MVVNMNIKIKTILLLQAGLIVFLSGCLLIYSAELKETKKRQLSQSDFCIKYTADIIASSRLDLIREQDAHQRDVDKANQKVRDIVYRYNQMAKRFKKDLINEYSYIIIRSNP